MMSLRPVLLIFLALVSLPSAHASPYNAVVVFGDSLSDNGNVLAATTLLGSPFPAAPYYNGRRSDGPVAVEYLANALGAPLLDYAYMGATTGLGLNGDGGNVAAQAVLPGMTTTYNAVKGGLSAPLLASGLFVVWGGPNDLLAPAPADVGNPTAIITRAVGNLVGIISDLQLRGAQSILVPGMSDLGLAPAFLAQGTVAAAQATAFTDAFNAALQQALLLLPVEVMHFDTATLMRNVAANPGTYGFTNATGVCYGGIGPTACANPGDYAYFDSLHPSTEAHALIAQGFLQAVPEPSSPVLLGVGLLVLAGARRQALAHASRGNA